MPLSDTQCRNAKPAPKQKKLSDGGGLYLLILPTGGKSWRLGYRFDGKQKAIALGQYPAVSLAQAREKRDEAKRLLAAGKDPAAEKQARAHSDNTFGSFARRWHDKEKEGWVERHASRVWARIERDVLPEIGSRTITEIEPPDVLAILRKVEDRGALDISKRLRQSIGAVFRFAIAEGKAKFNPASDLSDALRPKPKVRHFSKVKAAEIPELMEKIAQYDGDDQTRLAVLLAIHTFVRSNELRLAAWSEFENLDGEAPLWRIPADRMKMGREHFVPLSKQAVAILRDIKAVSGNSPHLFPSDTKSGFMSENTMIFALYRMGYHSRQTVHGFRGLASTVLNEHHFNRDWIERQLAHVEESEVRGAYNAAEWLPARREMMQWWSDYLDKPVG